VQHLTGVENAEAEAATRKAVEGKARVEAAVRKTAEERASTEAAARRAAEQKLAAEDARLKAEEQARKAAEVKPKSAAELREQAEKAEAALTLSEQDRKKVQVALNSLGHEMPSVTGYFGPRTRAAITAWQKKQGLPETGFLDASQLATLQEQATPAKRPDEAELDARQQAERAEAALNLSELDRKRVQVALNSLGHEMPTVTGYFGPRTRAMITAWQKAQGLPETGYLTEVQLAALRQQAAGALAKYDQTQTAPKENRLGIRD
jgi:peptidoglycan hydrolase-like protein with peptidoglycan-binding domain